jgi:hypothetical protein
VGRLVLRTTDARPACPKDLRASVACLTPAVRKARRSAVVTNLTLIYAMLRYLVGAWRRLKWVRIGPR